MERERQKSHLSTQLVRIKKKGGVIQNVSRAGGGGLDAGGRRVLHPSDRTAGDEGPAQLDA